VQWRKLNDRDPSLAVLTDKLRTKSMVAKLIGPSIVIPTLWQGDQLPIMAPWPKPFIVKANHGCRQYVVVRSEKDWRRATRIAPQWLDAVYGQWLDEWHYRAATRTLLVEPFIGSDDRLPVDYKVFVFGGRAEFVQVHLDRHANHTWVQLDRKWQKVSDSTNGCDVEAPPNLSQMLNAAERIGSSRDHLRVDFYDEGGRLWFGECCLFPGSGLDPFNPVSLDDTFGSCWTDARRQRY
jgi:hypothetical protein